MMSHHFLHAFPLKKWKIRWRKAGYRTALCPAQPTSPKTTFVPYLTSVWWPPSSSTAKVSQTEAHLFYGLTAVPNSGQPPHRRSWEDGQHHQVKTLLSWKSFEDNNVNILTREDRWFVRGVTESVYVKLKHPSLNRGGGWRHYLSPTYNTVLSSLPRQLNNHLHLCSPSLGNPHEGVNDDDY